MKQSSTSKRGGRKRTGGRRASPGAFVRILRGGRVVIGKKLRSDVTAADVFKYAVYSLLFLFLIVLRTTFFARFRPFGACPDILITAVAAVALYEGGRAGAVFGVAVGYVADALGGSGIILLPLPYMLVGYFCGIVATDHYKRSWALYVIFALCAAVTRAFTSLLYIMITWHAFDLSRIIASVIVPEFLSTLAVSPLPALLLLPVYFAFRRKKKELD